MATITRSNSLMSNCYDIVLTTLDKNTFDIPILKMLYQINTFHWMPQTKLLKQNAHWFSWLNPHTSIILLPIVPKSACPLLSVSHIFKCAYWNAPAHNRLLMGTTCEQEALNWSLKRLEKRPLPIALDTFFSPLFRGPNWIRSSLSVSGAANITPVNEPFL